MPSQAGSAASAGDSVTEVVPSSAPRVVPTEPSTARQAPAETGTVMARRATRASSGAAARIGRVRRAERPAVIRES